MNVSGTQTDWIEAELGEHVDLLTGFPFKSSQFVNEGDFIRLLKGSVVAPGSLNWDGCVGWPVGESSDYRKYELKIDDVVLAMDRPWLASGLKYAWITDVDLPSLLVQRVARLRGINGLNTAFLRYVIGGRDFANYIEPITTGVAVPHISPRQIGSFRFKLPPILTQKKIAAILLAYDDLIANNNRRISLLGEMAHRIFREWFVDFRYPGHEAIPLVDSALGPVPAGWTVARMDQVADVIDCLHSKKPSATRSGEGILLQLSNICDNGLINLSEVYRIARTDYNQWTTRIELQSGDCVITNVGRIAAVGQIPPELKLRPEEI